MLNVRELIWQADEQLACYPIEEVNLAAAAGLPGAEKIDHQGCFRRIQDAARKIKMYTLKRIPEFRKSPEVYENSEAKFRIVCMIRFLQKVCNVRYNAAKIPEAVPFDTADTFIGSSRFLVGNFQPGVPLKPRNFQSKSSFPSRKNLSCFGDGKIQAAPRPLSVSRLRTRSPHPGRFR